MTVSVIIPHWNRKDLLNALLRSLDAQRLPEGVRQEVIVVDNASGDGSREAARQRGAKVLPLPRNAGFSRAVNAGLEAAGGGYVAVLNNDVELEPDWMARLLNVLSSGQFWFATGKMLDYADRKKLDGAGDAVCRGGASWRLGHGRADGKLFATQRPTYFPSATATLFRRQFFERAGRFEEAFFAYLEDVDLGLRAAIEDLPGVYVPDAVAYHHGSAAVGAWSDQMVEWMTSHQLLLLAKFYPAGLLLRFARPILAAQLLWAALALSRGRARAWSRGFWIGARRFRKLRHEAGALRRRGDRLAGVLRAAEAEIEAIQRATEWDAYWKWYFRLA